MRWGSKPSNLFAFVIVFVAGLVVGQLIPPLWKAALIANAQSRYQDATYRCDRSMREHMIAKQRVISDLGRGPISELEAAEVALLDCQNYDLLRKRLILWGLSENDLSLMALKAIEAKAQGLQQVVETHEIRY